MKEKSQIDKDLFDKVIGMINPKFEDARTLSDLERQHLCKLIYLAFCDMRIFGREGRTDQAQALADAFHNLPLLMYRNDFSLRAFRDSLTRYQEGFEEKLITNFLQEMKNLNLSS